MNREAIKKHITNSLEFLTEEQLQEVHAFVEALVPAPDEEWNLVPFINSISEERKEVLQKLAQ